MSQWYIKGRVESVYFENASNFYKVILIQVIETNTEYDHDDIVVTGTFGSIHADTEYCFWGNLVDHAKYGVQFQVEKYQQESLASEQGLIQYLSSNKFQGIGSVLATRIVDVFKSETIEKIIADDPALLTIQGLTPSKKEMLVQTVQEAQGESQAVLQLIGYGFSDQFAYRIFNRYKQETLTVVQTNPFQLVEDIEGIGFAKADQIAETLGMPFDARERLRGALFYVTQEVCYTTGNTFLHGRDVLKHGLMLLEKTRAQLIDETVLAAELVHMVQTGALIEDDGRFALPSLYYAEEGIVASVERLLKQEDTIYPKIELDKEIARLEKTLGIQYSLKQKQAIKGALTQPLSVLTGGPGTGKTTVLKGIVTLYAQLNDLSIPSSSIESEFSSPLLLGAPTGRAAKRMKEMTGLPASTLHRLLGIGLTGQERDDAMVASLEGKFLIIDEMSMVDTWLMNWVLKAVPQGMQVLLVGDRHQLPSVGPGQVLHDILTCDRIPSVELDTVYRQQEQSTIVSLAHDIKDGIVSDGFTTNFADRSYFEVAENRVAELIEKVVTKAVAKGYSMKDIQVLAPMYKGPAGINYLNNVLQNVLNPNHDNRRRQVEHFDRVFRVGDKVLQLVNQPEQQVFNGDIGQVEAIIYANETEEKVDQLIVSFDGLEVVYNRSDWSNLTLAYCCSIHKSQGSEYPLVILPMVRQYGRMLRKDLLYTAVTRSKNALILCGEYVAFEQAIQKEVIYRQTFLSEKLNGKKVHTMVEVSLGDSQSVDHTKSVMHLTEQTIELIDPMIGMGDTTPYDFMV